MKLFYIATISFVCLLLSIIYIPQAQATQVKVVVIDAGHGGHDPGAIGITGVKEKDIVLKLALQLGALIQKNHPEIKVVYTRETDVFVELHTRTQIANKNKADVFISIHCNAVDRNSSAHGAESFVMGLDKSDANLAIAQKENASILSEQNYEDNYGGFDPSSPEAYIMFRMFQNKFLNESIKLAAAIQSEFSSKCKRQDRGVKQAPFLVLWRSAMPSVLVEAGFLSNSAEESYLASAKGQAELATAIYNGFAKLAETKIVEVDFTGIDTTAKPVILPVTKPNATASNSSQTSVVYKVQFMFIPQKLAKNDPKLKNLPDIEIEKLGSGYKYMAGNFDTHGKARELLTKAKNVGFTDAFIVAVDRPKTAVTPETTDTSAFIITQKEKLSDVPASASVVSSSKVVYKIQFMTFSEKLATNNPKLKGLTDIEIKKSNNTYIYISGKYDTYGQAQQQLSNVKAVGFKDAFVVCYDINGVRITLQQARELENKK